MPNPPLSRQAQLADTFLALGCDNATTTWDSTAHQYVFSANWHDGTDRPPVTVIMRGPDALQLMVLGGLEMSKQLAIQRPELTFPDVVWT